MEQGTEGREETEKGMKGTVFFTFRRRRLERARGKHFTYKILVLGKHLPLQQDLYNNCNF